MRALILTLWLAGAALPLAAQEADQSPQLQVTFEETEAIPGQMLSLRLTVLVPTFLPDPPVWPSLEAPNLLVRLPEGATGPTSARVGGETWSGVTRNYRLSPMVPGRFEIPAQQVVVTYADPDTSDPLQVTLSTEPLSFSGIVPEGAEALDPFIAATDLSLTQEIEGAPEALTPGGSVRRTVTARIAGTSPMFLPALLPPTQIEGVASYADEPVMEETADRGTLGGTRIESVSYVAEGGGRGTAPAVSLDWYNLDSGQVETASLDGFDVVVEGPPARTETPRDWRMVGVAVAAALLLLGLLWLAARRLWPVLRRQGTALVARWHGSERYAYRQLRQAVARRDHAALRPALDVWAQRVDGADPRQRPALAAALTGIGAARYGRGSGPDEAGAWKDMADALPAARRAARRRTASSDGLPPLNPS